MTSNSEPSNPPAPLRIAILSDTHAKYEKLTIPATEQNPIDLLIVAGDFTHHSRDADDLTKFSNWIDRNQHVKNVLICCGNSEMMARTMSREEIRERLEVKDHFHYLQDEMKHITEHQIACYASPWQASRNMGFSAKRDKLKEIFSQIHEDTEILVTHMPPYSVLDEVAPKKIMSLVANVLKGGRQRGRRWGCHHLLDRVRNLDKLKLCVFGHVHEFGGMYQIVEKNNGEKVLCINGAMSIWPPSLSGRTIRDVILIDWHHDTGDFEVVKGLTEHIPDKDDETES